MSNYVTYHLHDDLSLLDSTTKYKDYIDKAVELGQKAICFTNHGNIYNYTEKKMYCDKVGIKYLHGVEIYLTESHEARVRDNYHTILIAKNQKGFNELNRLVDLSTRKDHFYHKPRLSFDEFLNISDDIIKISSCILSPLSKLSKENLYYYKIAQKYDYYEVQPHLNFNEQVVYNKELYLLSKTYNKPLIAGTDTHSLNAYKAECRLLLQKAKGITFKKKKQELEEGNDNEQELDLTYKSYDEIVEMFKAQGALPESVFLEAIHNTNVMADSCEEIQLDTSYKYPILSNDDKKLFKDMVAKKYKEKVKKGIIPKDQKYKENILEEFRVFKKIGMLSFLLFMSELTTWCRENNIPYGFTRGSVGGSTIAYILDIIDLDPVTWKTVFSRFANEDRIEIGDIDIDFSPTQRELVYEYIINRFGINKSAYILAIGTISDKGTIDEIGRALEYPLDYVAQIKKDYEQNPEVAKTSYPELFYFFDGLLDTAVSQSIHPAGIVASPVTLPNNYGTFWKDNKRILQIDMNGVHEVNLVKYDILGLKNIEVIKDTCGLIGIKYPLSHEINWEDEAVWDDIITSPVGLFQFESQYGFDLLKQYKPKKINDLSLINASLRPSGTSYRDRLIAREFNQNPSKEIDELLKDNNGYLVFQEDTIKFLQNICGLSGSEADNIRRAIGRKQRERLEKALPSILEGYCQVSGKPREVAEEEAKTFLQIIEDSSEYQFGFNHSTGYSMNGYLCGYYRYYNPLEFITSFLNNANNDDDIKNGTELAKLKGIQISPIKFRKSLAKYTCSKVENTIYKGIASIKHCGAETATELYKLKDNTYDSFLDLLIDIAEQTTVNSKQMDILTRLDFFSEFGGNQKLLEFTILFQEIYGSKQMKKDKALKLGLDPEEVLSFARETEKTFMDFQSKEFLQYMWKKLENKSLSIIEQVKSEIDYLGYVQSTYPDITPSYVMVLEVDTKYTPRVLVHCFNDGKQYSYKIPKKIFNNNKLNEQQTIRIIKSEEKQRVKKEGDKWVEIEGKDLFLFQYTKVK